MSKLYLSATTDAIKTERTARGHRHIKAHIRGWHSGIEVEAATGPKDNAIEYRIYLTEGSSGGTNRREVALFKAAETGELIQVQHFHHETGTPCRSKSFLPCHAGHPTEAFKY